MKQRRSSLYVKELVLISFLSIIITVGKQTLATIPNIEVVSFLFIVYTIVLGVRRTFLISIIFSTVEILIWGFGLWTFGYYLFWPLLIIIANFFKNRIKHRVGWAILSGLFGLSFGLLFAIYTAPLTKINILVYWVNGITFDIFHMVGNFTIMILLFEPVKEVLESQVKKMNILKQFS
ncbi:hypothetical protein RJG79_03685 [Mycoplasmatota bacterium WC44]